MIVTLLIPLIYLVLSRSQDCLAQRDKEVELCFKGKSKAAHSDAPARFVN